MSDAFSEREKGYEAKFKMDQELQFKAESRRNKLLGLWLAEKFGMDGATAESYAKEVIVSDMEEPGVEDVVRKVMADIEGRGGGIGEEEVRDKIKEFDSVAMQQIAEEMPDALEKDHDGAV